MTLKDQLAKRYFDILNQDRYQPLIQQIAQDECNTNQKPTPKHRLCNIFLGSVPENYENAQHKILIVGRETRGWRGGMTVPHYDMDNVIKSMNHGQTFFEKQISIPQKDGRFLGFAKKVADRAGADGLLWANMFAVSDNLSTPDNHQLFDDIKQLSKELLLAQIELLRPDFILLVNGHRKSVQKARHEYFKELTWAKVGHGNLHKRYLEQCFLNLDIKNTDGSPYQPICYRTHHPSTRSPQGKKGLAQLLEHLPKG
ncbi:Uncharacterised protein [Moraxella lacunata]|uniref:Uracil DNA glycosylase superfamily n=1 Tax=Moraxella lacunata TaxID=477 RepID=A0A1V4H3U4_MORLA|nr:hypothetical protein [Moraxella lacunata]OPH39231.1 hypothetical protein B5J94_01085 [Moraxella lacunata]STZ00982.1 Uncharacterised protein [Moraxella lacunata]